MLYVAAAALLRSILYALQDKTAAQVIGSGVPRGYVSKAKSDRCATCTTTLLLVYYYVLIVSRRVQASIAVLCSALAYKRSSCITESSTAPYDKQCAQYCYYSACADAIYTAEY
jgi:hypothetical protein